MRHSTRQSTFRRHLLLLSRALAVIGFALTCLMPAAARAGSDESLFRGGVHNSRNRPLTTKQLQTLLKGLSFWTGLTEMSFDEAGFLNLGDRTHVAGGSATARLLLIAAVDGQDSFVLENYNRSPAVAFTQIESIAITEDAAGIRRGIWLLKLDFSDFNYLRGEDRVVAAFDPAVNLLHELGHGVLKKLDPIRKGDQLGDCERHINLMRAELGLPERQTYHAQKRLAVAPGQAMESLQAELAFVQTGPGNKKKTFFLSYDIENVSTFAAPQPGRETRDR